MINAYRSHFVHFSGKDCRSAAGEFEPEHVRAIYPDDLNAILHNARQAGSYQAVVRILSNDRDLEKTDEQRYYGRPGSDLEGYTLHLDKAHGPYDYHIDVTYGNSRRRIKITN